VGATPEVPRAGTPGAPLVIVQWQNGVPVTIFPTERAFAKPTWPKS